MYMKDKTVDDIFVAQVDRIGKQLELLENALAKNPRIVTKKTNRVPRTVQFHNWVPQGLKEKWFVYMDVVYNRANKKGLDFMEDNLKRLNKEYPDKDKDKISQTEVDNEKDGKVKSGKAAERKLRQEMPGYIRNLEAAWSKAKDWPKPKWNAKKS